MHLSTIRRYLREGDFKRIATPSSSVVAGVGYIPETPDEQKGTLLVFLSGSMKAYAYPSTRNVFRAFETTKSAGQYFTKKLDKSQGQLVMDYKATGLQQIANHRALGKPLPARIRIKAK